MPNLYITEQNSVLRKTGDRIIVKKDDKILLEVKCRNIDAVLIFGNVQFTTQVVHELFEHDIEMAILTQRGKLIGQITSPSTKNIELRLEQFKKYWDSDFRLSFSKSVVSGKIKNSLLLLKKFSYNHQEKDFAKEKQALEKAENDLAAAKNINELMGMEGIAAKNYFSAFAKMLLGQFGFPGRKKHPSTDPVNALLSLGYTMVFNEIASLLDGLGFDPYLSYFHSADYGRASLASDLIEEFRAPIVDRFTLHILNDNIFNKEDFYPNPANQAVYLQREAMKRYFVEYEEMLNRNFQHPETDEATTYRKCFRRQAEKLALCLKDNITYVPFKKEY